MKTILVIEDEVTIRDTLVELLQIHGFNSVGCEDGLIGLQTAYKIQPDLILCDIHLPNLDGYQILQELRQNPLTMAIPFIFLTARGTQRDLRRGMALGADDYLTKPCDTDELLGAIAVRMAKQELLAQQFRIIPPRAEGAPGGVATPDSDTTREGLIHYFYQELRNPLSNLNMAIHLLRQAETTDGETCSVATIQQEYSRELAILSQVFRLQPYLATESFELLRQCNLIQNHGHEENSCY